MLIHISASKVNRKDKKPLSSIPPFCNTFLFTLGFLVLFTSFASADSQTSAWLVRFDMNNPEKIAAHCREAKAIHLDSLLLQVRGRADALYQSNYAPRAEILENEPFDFDPLAATLKKCAPIPIHAWINIFYLWTGDTLPLDPTHPAQPAHDWIIKDADGRMVSEYNEFEQGINWIEGIYADPASLAYRELIARVVEELTKKYPISGIHLDFVRYPGLAFGHGGNLAGKFERKWGINPQWLPVERPDMNAWLDGSMPKTNRILTTALLLWLDARANEVTATVHAVHDAIHKSGQAITLSAAVFPDADEAYLEKGQDWQAWVTQGLVDALYPMAYFGGPERVEGQLRKAKEFTRYYAPKTNLWAGLGAYIKEPEVIAEEAAQAELLGYDKICLFSLGHLLKKQGGTRPYIRALRGETPQSMSIKRAAFETTNLPSGVNPAAHYDPANLNNDDILGSILAKALGGFLPSHPRLNALLQERMAEFNTARKKHFPDILQKLAQEQVNLPEWVELRGIFRYVHPLDGPEKIKEQREECEKARQQVLRGNKFSRIARRISQGGNRLFEGKLKRRFLCPVNQTDKMLASLAPGELSPIVKADNGYWFFLITQKGKTEKKQFLAQIPWAARRILFRQLLSEDLSE